MWKYAAAIISILFLAGCGDRDFILKRTCIEKHGNPIINVDGEFKGCDYQENQFRFHYQKDKNTSHQ